MTEHALLILAGVVAASAVVAIRRGWDVRFTLGCAGLVLCAAAGMWYKVFDAFQATLGRADIIGPICSAMGYAWVLKATGCDAHMVRLLTRPLQRLRWALVPGGIAVGFITNMAITSQTATAAAVGPILIPILIAAGHRPLIAGAVLVVGCSLGGNLFNPGEPDIVAIHAATQMDVGSIINATVVPNLISLLVATSVMIVLASRMQGTEHPSAPASTEPVSVVKALLPPLPVLLLLALQPGLDLVPPLLAIYPKGVHVSMVMLVCTAIVVLLTRQGTVGGHVARLTAEFFEGMGYAFARVISLIVAASCFIAGLDAVGAIKSVAALLVLQPDLATVLSPVVTWGLAVISGSGTAPSVSFTQAMVPGVAAVDVAHGVDLGILGAIGASLGRTMSPVAAIVLFTSTLVEARPTELVRLVKWPILAALAVVIAFGLFS
jgi:C4-dicarboxylate transporter, DcuC family